MGVADTMVFKRFQLSTIQQCVELGTSLPYYWFRGHAKQYGNLAPKVFRDPYKNKLGDNELHFASRFALEAPALFPSCPAEDDDLSWLFLMQHHGCPTRLLDWSQSVLVALYFAVSHDHDKDGELWVINPAALNQVSVGMGVLFSGDSHRVVRQLAAQARIAPQPPVRNPPQSAIAIVPPAKFTRLVSQFSRFTIHPRPQNGKPIEQALSDPYIGCYIVPAQYKPRLHDALCDLGITDVSIFADLDALSRTVEYHVLRPSRLTNPETLPECDGERD